MKKVTTHLNSRSFFLFGPRGTGKSTLLYQWKEQKSYALYDFLDPAVEAELHQNPNLMIERCNPKRRNRRNIFLNTRL